GRSEWALRVKGVRLSGLKKNYAEGKKGAANLIVNSSGHLEIFVPGGARATFWGSVCWMKR
ncbi:MAG: hypothetical protein MPW15_07115, partial [Candidatus Manganitrophus sp.]|nr:hypothetical protein [Candidatus Manganitrophus sp.]